MPEENINVSKKKKKVNFLTFYFSIFILFFLLFTSKKNKVSRNLFFLHSLLNKNCSSTITL